MIRTLKINGRDIDILKSAQNETFSARVFVNSQEASVIENNELVSTEQGVLTWLESASLNHVYGRMRMKFTFVHGHDGQGFVSIQSDDLLDAENAEVEAIWMAGYLDGLMAAKY